MWVKKCKNNNVWVFWVVQRTCKEAVVKMVEGPKVYLKALRLKSLVNQRVVRSECAALQVLFKGCLDLKVIEILVVGKELFIIFQGSLHLRIHFGMDGAEVIIV